MTVSRFVANIGVARTIIFLTLIADIIGFYITGIGVNRSIATPVIVCVVLVLVEAFYLFIRPRHAIACFCGDVANIIALASTGIILSYLTITAKYPLVDDLLYAVDTALGLDWFSYYWLCKSMPTSIQSALNFAYSSLGEQIIVLTVAFSFLSIRYGRQELARGSQLFVGYALGGLTAIVIAVFLPARGEFIRYGVELNTHYIPEFIEAYEGATKVIDLANADGIITFPSFHATLSVMLVWSAIGRNFLFYPALLINAVAVFATPLLGGHYFVDVIVGIVIALFWIAVLKRIPVDLLRPACYSALGPEHD